MVVVIAPTFPSIVLGVGQIGRSFQDHNKNHDKDENKVKDARMLN